MGGGRRNSFMLPAACRASFRIAYNPGLLDVLHRRRRPDKPMDFWRAAIPHYAAAMIRVASSPHPLSSLPYDTVPRQRRAEAVLPVLAFHAYSMPRAIPADELLAPDSSNIISSSCAGALCLQPLQLCSLSIPKRELQISSWLPGKSLPTANSISASLPVMVLSDP